MSKIFFTTHPWLLAVGLAGVLSLPAPTLAQPYLPDGFGGYYDPQERQQEDLHDWSRDYLEQEYERQGFGGPSAYERDREDYWNQRDACNAFTNNARARELCLQGLR